MGGTDVERASFYARTRKAWGAGASAAGMVAGAFVASGEPEPWQIGAVVGAFLVAFGVTWAAPNAE